jgi:hypothetical protein
MSTVLQLAGAVLVTAGVALIFIPAGLIVAGVFALLIGLAVRK